MTCIVAKSEKEIDLEVFADEQAGSLEELEIDDADEKCFSRSCASYGREVNI